MAERMIFALINEAAKILAEGIAARPSDIDVVWVYGYGFPRWRGGPLAYADEIGLPYIVERLDTFAGQAGDETLSPASLLRELAEKGTTFRSEEHTSELQSLMRISSAVFCLKKTTKKIHNHRIHN